MAVVDLEDGLVREMGLFGIFGTLWVCVCVCVCVGFSSGFSGTPVPGSCSPGCLCSMSSGSWSCFSSVVSNKSDHGPVRCRVGREMGGGVKEVGFRCCTSRVYVCQNLGPQANLKDLLLARADVFLMPDTLALSASTGFFYPFSCSAASPARSGSSSAVFTW